MSNILDNTASLQAVIETLKTKAIGGVETCLTSINCSNNIGITFAAYENDEVVTYTSSVEGSWNKELVVGSFIVVNCTISYPYISTEFTQIANFGNGCFIYRVDKIANASFRVEID